jgi:Zn-finger nucleic acid-binding protein
MNCVNCGAGLQPVGNRNYFRCPYCETFHFPAETEDGIAVVGRETQHGCPVCAKPLTTAAIDGHEVSYCKVCRGFLADNATFSRIVQLKRAKNSSPAVPIPFEQDELKRRVSCPSCKKPMDTHPYHAGGNAVIDTCHRCRLVWLDAGELTVLGRYQSRSGPVAVPLPRVPVPPEPEPEPVIDLFGFRIRLGG